MTRTSWLLVWALVAALGFAPCAKAQDRAAAVADLVAPTPEQVFAAGRFNIKKNPLKVLAENHYGEELELGEKRPAFNLQGTVFERKYGREGTQLYANFYHRGGFYIVRVPDRGVSNVYFQLSYFPPKVLGRYIAAHSLLRLEMDPQAPVELVTPMPTVEQLDALRQAAPEARPSLLPAPLPADAPENRVRNVAISAEAQWTKADPFKKYDLKRGTLGAYVQIVRFLSMQTRLEGFFDSGNPATQIRFDLDDPREGDAILREALRTSQSDGLGKLYDTFWYNCTTLAFDIVERASNKKDRRVGFVRSFMQKRVPVISRDKLEQYGGLEAMPMHTDASLGEEFAAAYQTKVAKPGRDLCPRSMDAPNCENVKAARVLVEARSSG